MKSLPLLLLGLLTVAAPRLCRANIAVIGALAREHNVSSGGTFEGEIRIRNAGVAPAAVRLSQSDYSFTADGSNFFPAGGQLPRSNASWIVLDQTLLRVAPSETAVVHYRGQVPAGFVEPGSRWSLILVQETAPGTPKDGVLTITRYGVQVVTQMGDTGARSVRFMHRSVDRSGASARYALDLENDGDRLIFPQVGVELYTADGARVGRFEASPSRLYPGCSARFSVDLAGVASGKYQAVILVDCGNDQIIGTRCELPI